MKRIVIAIVLTLALAYSPELLRAQWSVGPHIVISVPKSDFANVSGTGGGFGIKVVRSLNALGRVGLRGDFSFMNYDHGFENIQGYVAETRNTAFRLTFGPDVGFGSKKLKFRVGAMGGFYFFKTDVNISTGFQFFQDSRNEEVALGLNVGGGFMYDIGLGPLLDVELRYQNIFDVSTPATVDENGNVLREASRINAREITLKVGVIFFLGK